MGMGKRKMFCLTTKKGLAQMKHGIFRSGRFPLAVRGGVKGRLSPITVKGSSGSLGKRGGCLSSLMEGGLKEVGEGGPDKKDLSCQNLLTRDEEEGGLCDA